MMSHPETKISTARPSTASAGSTILKIAGTALAVYGAVTLAQQAQPHVQTFVEEVKKEHAKDEMKRREAEQARLDSRGETVTVVSCPDWWHLNSNEGEVIEIAGPIRGSLGEFAERPDKKKCGCPRPATGNGQGGNGGPAPRPKTRGRA